MKTKLTVLAFFILLLAAGLWFWKNKSSTQEKFREAAITRGDLTVTILTTGTVQPENRLEIKPPVAGRIDKILVKEGQMVKKGQVLAWMSSSERAALLDSARAQGTEEVARWEELYKPTPVMAPISGMIILKNIENGQTFTINDAVLVMSNRLTIKAQVDETDLAQIKVNQVVDVRLDAYPTTKIEATVERIAYEARTVSNVTTYLIVVVPKMVPDFMRSGMTANVTFYVDIKKNILLLPTEFLKYDNGKPIVLLKVKEGKPKETPVVLGSNDGKQTEIISGVNEGDILLVTDGSDKEPKAKNPFSPFGNTKPKKVPGH